MAQVVDVLKMTPAEFEVYATAPENADRRLELIGGEVVAVVSSEQSSSIAMRVGGKLMVYLERNPIGYLTAPDGGFAVGDDRLLPDVGFVLFKDSPAPRRGVYNRGLSLAIEVISPTDDHANVASKVYTYTQDGVEVWLVDPDAETVTVFIPGHAHFTLRRGDVLAGDPLLSGLNLPIAEIFTWPGQQPPQAG